MNSRFAPSEPLPHFLSGRVDEHEPSGRAEDDEPRESILVLNASVLVMTTALISIALTLSWGSPAKVFANIRASVSDTSSVRTDTVQSVRSIQAASSSQALPPAAPATSSRDENLSDIDSAGQKQAEAGALLGQFQAWATTQDGPVQNGSAQDGPIYVAHAQPTDDDRAEAPPVRSADVAPAQEAQGDEAPVRSVRRHRTIRPVQNARAEMRSVRHRLARARQDRIARAQARPAQQVRAPEQPAQPVQPAQPPSFMQSFGWQQQ